MQIRDKHKFIVEKVLETGCSRAEAYHQAFPTCKRDRAKHYAWKVFQRPEVIEYYNHRQKEIYDSMNITAERLAMELASMAFAPKGDEVYTPSHKIQAVNLLQKQMGLQTQRVEANVVSNIVVDIDEHND